ncbi:DegV family protein [Chloroflexi bacterium TSY]|nr:DegV family protein [Chloroflexi bacterium TSY]
MDRVGIVTDSNACLSPKIRAEYGIEVIPHRIKIGNNFFEEDETFSAREMFAKMEEMQLTGQDDLPEIQPADLNAILDFYHDVGTRYTEIVSVHVSSHLSPLWFEARKAAEILKGRLTIRVFDSLSTSFGLGLLAQKAAITSNNGANINEIARVINGTIPHLYFTGFSESLSYLERSAQLSASQSLLGTMLGIKAMLMMEEGALMPLEKVQTRDEVVDKLVEFVTEFASVEEVGLVQDCYEEHQTALIQRLQEDSRLRDIPIHQVPYPPSLAAHIGSNVLGVVVYEGAF